MTTYVMTDDPNDPCGLCVMWEEQPDDFMGENAVPWSSPTQRADRIYQAVHEDCERAAMEYVAESGEW